jgi:hypothetical protein
VILSRTLLVKEDSSYKRSDGCVTSCVEKEKYKLLSRAEIASPAIKPTKKNLFLSPFSSPLLSSPLSSPTALAVVPS